MKICGHLHCRKSAALLEAQLRFAKARDLKVTFFSHTKHQTDATQRDKSKEVLLKLYNKIDSEQSESFEWNVFVFIPKADKESYLHTKGFCAITKSTYVGKALKRTLNEWIEQTLQANDLEDPRQERFKRNWPQSIFYSL